MAIRCLPNGHRYLGIFSGEYVNGRVDYYFNNDKSFHEIDVTAKMGLLDLSSKSIDRYQSKRNCALIDQDGPTSFGALIFYNNICIEGFLNQGKLEGPATIKFPNGTSYIAEYRHNKLIKVTNDSKYKQELAEVSKDNLFEELDLQSQSLEVKSIENIEQIPPLKQQDIYEVAIDKAKALDQQLSPYWQKYNLLLEQFNQNILGMTIDNKTRIVNAEELYLRVIDSITEINSIGVALELKPKKDVLSRNFTDLKNQLKQMVDQFNLKTDYLRNNSLENSANTTLHEFKIINPHDSLSNYKLVINTKLWSQLPQRIQQQMLKNHGNIKFGDHGNIVLKPLDNDTFEVKFHDRFFGDFRIGCIYNKAEKVIEGQAILNHKGIVRLIQSTKEEKQLKIQEIKVPDKNQN
jgi:hypothetical protein